VGNTNLKILILHISYKWRSKIYYLFQWIGSNKVVVSDIKSNKDNAPHILAKYETFRKYISKLLFLILFIFINVFYGYEISYNLWNINK